MHGGHGPEVVEWTPSNVIQRIVVPTVMVDVLSPLTASMNWVPPSEVAPTSCTSPCGVGVGVGPDGVGVRTEGVGVIVGVCSGGVGVAVVTGVTGWSRAPATKIGSVVLLSMTAA